MAVLRLQASKCGEGPTLTDGLRKVAQVVQRHLTIADITRTVERVLDTVTVVSHDTVTAVTEAASHHHDIEHWRMCPFTLFV